MFTGIIEEVGRVRRAGQRLAVSAEKVTSDSAPGSSIAMNGVCLTVVEVDAPPPDQEGGTLWFDLSQETMERTSLHRLVPGDPVNLERPVTMLTRLGGHLVQGHVDGVGEILAMNETPPGITMVVRLPDDLRRYVVEEGSIAVDGVSLTVTGVTDSRFAVALIPFTLQATTFGSLGPGDPVNLETDVIAKYVEGLMRR